MIQMAHQVISPTQIWVLVLVIFQVLFCQVHHWELNTVPFLVATYQIQVLFHVMIRMVHQVQSWSKLFQVFCSVHRRELNLLPFLAMIRVLPLALFLDQNRILCSIPVQVLNHSYHHLLNRVLFLVMHPVSFVARSVSQVHHRAPNRVLFLVLIWVSPLALFLDQNRTLCPVHSISFKKSITECWNESWS